MVLNSLEPGAIMMELGASWGFYSLWFLRAVPCGKAYMIEPESFALECGERNFKLNGLRGDFTYAFIGNEPRPGDPPTIRVGEVAADKCWSATSSSLLMPNSPSHFPSTVCS